MTPRQEENLENRVNRLKDQNRLIREKLAAFRKENQSLQRSLRDTSKLLEGIPGGVVLIQEGNLIFTNETVREKLGYAEGEILGRNFLDFIHPDSVEHIRRLYQKRISDRAVPDRYETYVSTKTGEALCCEVRVKKIRYQGRRAFLLNILEVNDRKKREKQLARSQKIEALVRMASGVSQEFNSCLSILDEHVLHPVNLEDPPDANLTECLKKVVAFSEKAGSFTQKMATIAKLDHDRSNAVLFDLKKTVQDAVSLARSKWEQAPEHRGVNINVKTYLRSLSPVEGRPEEIQDVVLNIILNAGDALPEGGEIYLTTEENSGFAHVYIQDNGEGIAEEIRGKIFDPFFTSRDTSRMGLGLSLAYAIINRHGGEIEVMSRKGQGTTFITRLPLAQKTPLPKARGAKKRIRNSHILIIVDEGMVKELLSLLFVSKGGKITAVSTGAEGLKLLKKNEFDLVLIDVNTTYPGSSKLISKIKKMRQGLPVVLVNAGEKGVSSSALKKLGADLVIGRPLDMDRILSLASKALAMGKLSE